jgi:hypothetical protein
VDPIADLDVMGEEKNRFPLSACILIAIPTALSRLLDCHMTNLTAPSIEHNAYNGYIKSIFSREVEM